MWSLSDLTMEEVAKRAKVGKPTIWHKYQLTEIRTIQVESWLRRLPLAKSSCAKIRNLMSVLFNHACRYELFDRNPIYLVRQSAKRRRIPVVLMPTEIKALVDNLSIRERTLVLLAGSTGLRQCELFRLKMGRHRLCPSKYERHALHRVRGSRSVQDRVIAKPVPIHPLLADALLQ
jgi:site-specific recombinase XerD